ncbi:formate/nitrite transporter family protein [Halobacterium zhouii]|uniref:formate/nitrite transporter family protein n=1 Tax=Halobacterium zhouii TaxID=2902624 RepID=UPI001E5EB470|nr:formate/nitrite transporter family protein [Halobacterium zhouii]
MARGPTPAEIFDRAVDEGQRRLDQSLLELVSTSFIAGFTIVFGVVALGIVEAIVHPRFGDVSRIAGSLAFGIGLMFLIAGRTELFNENFSDPTAAAIDGSGSTDRSRSQVLWKLVRLWAVTFVFNFVGGGLFALVFSVEGVLPPGTAESLVTFAEETTHKSAWAWFADAIAGGALVSLLSFLLAAVESSGSRLVMAYVVGFLLALGPFSHVVVTALHVFFGILFGANIGFVALAEMIGIVTAGNFVGGLGLVTLTHVAQAKGANESSD